MYKIYVVEDDKGIADGISQCLAAWEMEVVTVSDFRNVIGEINEIGPHLIIMDITLPYMGGYHWCREIRKTSNVPIIFISSATDNMNIIMAMNMGADDYIPKPFDQSILIAKVQALLRRTYDFSRNTFSLSAGGAVLNTDDNTLTFEGKKIRTNLRFSFRQAAQGIAKRCRKRREHRVGQRSRNVIRIRRNRLKRKLTHGGHYRIADYFISAGREKCQQITERLDCGNGQRFTERFGENGQDRG